LHYDWCSDVGYNTHCKNRKSFQGSATKSGVNPAAFDNPQGSQGATELLNTFGGGALKRFSIFDVGYNTHCKNRKSFQGSATKSI
jgi:hypothetical protein